MDRDSTCHPQARKGRPQQQPHRDVGFGSRLSLATSSQRHQRCRWLLIATTPPGRRVYHRALPGGFGSRLSLATSSQRPPTTTTPPGRRVYHRALPGGFGSRLSLVGLFCVDIRKLAKRPTVAVAVDSNNPAETSGLSPGIARRVWVQAQPGHKLAKTAHNNNHTGTSGLSPGIARRVWVQAQPSCPVHRTGAGPPFLSFAFFCRARSRRAAG